MCIIAKTNTYYWNNKLYGYDKGFIVRNRLKAIYKNIVVYVAPFCSHLLKVYYIKKKVKNQACIPHHQNSKPSIPHHQNSKPSIPHHQNSKPNIPHHQNSSKI